jgi:hypothetical protein
VFRFVTPPGGAGRRIESQILRYGQYCVGARAGSGHPTSNHPRARDRIDLFMGAGDPAGRLRPSLGCCYENRIIPPEWVSGPTESLSVSPPRLTGPWGPEAGAQPFIWWRPLSIHVSSMGRDPGSGFLRPRTEFDPRAGKWKREERVGD